MFVSCPDLYIYMGGGGDSEISYNYSNDINFNIVPIRGFIRIKYRDVINLILAQIIIEILRIFPV